MNLHKPEQQVGPDINETDTISHSDVIIENPAVEDVDNSKSKKIYPTIAGDKENSSDQRVKPTGADYKMATSCFGFY